MTAWTFLAAAAAMSGMMQVQAARDSEHARLLDTFGLLSVEEHAEAGSEMRRALFVDDHGRPMIAVVFLRSPLSEPVMRVHFARRGASPRATPLEARVPPAMWEAVLDRSGHFDRALGPGGDPVICSHGWTYTVEAVDPAVGFRGPVVRRTSENACERGLAWAFARELAAEAITLLPACGTIEPQRRGFAATRLHACRMLAGDRLAAAEALNAANPLRSFNSAAERRSAALLFAGDATLDWNGARSRGPSVPAAWIEGAGAASLFFEAIEGETADRVRVRGFLNRVFREPAFREERASVEMVWTRGAGMPFRIESVRVGAFEAVTD